VVNSTCEGRLSSGHLLPRQFQV